MSNQPPLTLVKIGGHVIEYEDSLNAFLRQFAQLEGDKILVHGGGQSASAMAHRLGIVEKKEQGRRITDKETLEVVTMVYGGLVNKKLVASLQSLGINALGLTGADGNAISAKKRPNHPIDYGFVGDVVADDVNLNFFEQLLRMGITPVIAPLTHDKKGHLLNTNADTLAAQVAIAMQVYRPVRLLFCFEQKGVWSNSQSQSTIKELSSRLRNQLFQEGVIQDGMVPKLTNAFCALENGVQEIRILHFADLLDWQMGKEPGTKMVSSK